MLDERRAEFWENVCEGDGMSKNTDVWMLIKWCVRSVELESCECGWTGILRRKVRVDA